MTDPDIQKEFARFAGREFPMQRKMEDDPKYGKILTFRVTNHDDATLNEMVDAAEKLGLSMAFNLPVGGSVAYGEKKNGEVAAQLEEGADGKFRIGKTFTLSV